MLRSISAASRTSIGVSSFKQVSQYAGQFVLSGIVPGPKPFEWSPHHDRDRWPHDGMRLH